MVWRIAQHEWTEQPQEVVRLADAYADAHAVFLGSTPDAMLGRAGDRWTRNGSPLVSVGPRGIGTQASSYTTADYWTGPSFSGTGLGWTGVTVVCVVGGVVDLAVNELPGAMTVAPTGEVYGVANLTLERLSNGRRVFFFRAGDSAAYLTTTTYNSTPGSDQWSAGDDLVIVGRFDRATSNIAVWRNGTITRNSNAHSYGWRTGTHLLQVGGYVRSGNRMLTSPLTLAAIIPRDVGPAAEAELLADPYSLFAPAERRIWVPASGGPGTANLEGSATASATGDADLSLVIPLGGSAQAQASGDAALSLVVPIAGTAIAASVAAGEIELTITLQASALAEALASAGLSLAVPLAGSAGAQSSATGELEGSATLSGEAQSQALANGALSISVNLSADAAAAVGASGAVTLSVPLAGVAQALASGDADLLVVSAGLTGAAVAIAQASGSLQIEVLLSGAGGAQVTALGTLTGAEQLIIVRLARNARVTAEIAATSRVTPTLAARARIYTE